MSKFPWLDAFTESSAEITLQDSNGVFLWANERAAKTLGLSREQLIGKKPADVFPSDVEIRGLPLRAVKERRVLQAIRNYPLQGTNRWFDIRCSPVSPERTAGNGWCGLLHAVDITAQVQFSALKTLLGMRDRVARKVDEDERFLRLVLKGSSISDLCVALRLTVEQVTSRLTALAGTPLA